jgi:predicted NUDIX family NTP pyrophosphohydrolase
MKIQWPYKSGKYISVPEVDKLEFFPISLAREKINQAQKLFLERLMISIS